MMKILPLTPGRWRDLAALFGERGACGGCWCMFWRLPRAVFHRQKGRGNRDAFRKVVKRGDPPGLIAYDGTTPIGWCAIAPRDEYPALARSRILKPVDERPVWSVACLFIAKPYRRRGVSVRLLKAASAHVRRRGGRIVEGYPVEPPGRMADAFVWTGLASAFRRAGFREVARRSKTRPIMRRDLT
jgi:GNAT superfamily N-acetyltransferase